jgi:RNA polymerase sigma-70 factor (ECF subfamily)
MGVTRTDFEQLYRENFPDIRRFVFHLVQDPSLADELTQDAFLRAHAGWNEFRGDAPQRVWLFRIARNVSMDYLRSPPARALRDRSLETIAGEGSPAAALIAAGGNPPSTVEETAHRTEMSECVQEFVKSLPETLRTPLLLHDMEGLTNAEIARVLGCSLQAAKMRLHRARARLREMMEARCDLFHDERNVLSCLPTGPQPPEPAFISLQDVAVR